MRTSHPFSAVVILLLGCAPQAMAHHSAAPHFDLEKTIELHGAVTKFEFVNPHGYVYFTVAEADGRKTPWRCELAGRLALTRLGWTRDTFHPGQQVTIKGAPARREANDCYLTSFILEDGREIGRDQPVSAKATAAGRPAIFGQDAAVRPARLPNGRPNLLGLWVAAFGPGGGRGRGPGRPGGRGRGGPPGAPELTADGIAAGKTYDQRFDDPAIKCSPANILFGWTHDQHVNEITQNNDDIIVKYGYMDLVRTIHLNGQHPKNIMPSLEGHSIGRWEGDVLVVDTIGFKSGVLLPMEGTMHSGQLHVEERFTLDPAGNKLTRGFKAEDPAYWKTSYTGSDVMLLSKEPWVSYECKELSGKNNQRPQ